MLTAAGTLEDRIEGLGHRRRRLSVASRFTSPSWSPGSGRSRAARGRPCRRLLVHGDLELDSARDGVVDARRATRSRSSPKEFAVLELLLGAEGAVVSTEELLERAWDDADRPVHQRGADDGQPAAGQARATRR